MSFYRALEHRQVLVPVGVLELSLTDTEGQLESWGSQNLHVNFVMCVGSAPLTPTLFQGQLDVLCRDP